MIMRRSEGRLNNILNPSFIFGSDESFPLIYFFADEITLKELCPSISFLLHTLRLGKGRRRPKLHALDLRMRRKEKKAIVFTGNY